MAEKVVTLFTDNVIAAGVMFNAAFTVTVAFEVFNKLSVTRTVTEPVVAGAVNAPVAETMLPPPLTIEYEYGLTPPVAENVCVPLTANVTKAGVIASAELIVIAESEVCDNESVTLTTALPATASAVYAPVDELIVPDPEKTEYVYGANPPEAENVNTLFGANVFDTGEIKTALTTVTVAFDVFVKLSVTRTVTVPAAPGAVNAPVAETMLPPPLTIEYEYGLTPPVAVNVCVPLATMFIDTGEITNAAFTVTVAFEIFDNESVTRTVTVPVVAGAVNTPVAATILPPPLTIEYA